MKEKLSKILYDENFEKLELALKEPNIFKALSVERKEIRHSNFVSYLLNPNANHGLGSIFLKKTLMDIFSDSKSSSSIFDVDQIDFRLVEIRREWKNIDILVLLENDVIVIENKIDSMDHSNQLQRYKEIVESTFSNHNLHYVFLTPFGNDPKDIKSHKTYINYSYEQIAFSLQSVLKIYRNNLSPKIIIYIEDYLKILKLELLMNDELNKIALSIYNTHKEAFDFVIENKPDPASILYPYFEEVLKQKGYIIGSKNKGFIRFTSPKLNTSIPKKGSTWPDKESFLFEIDYFWSGKYAKCKATISPCEDSIKTKILNAVNQSKFYKHPSGVKWSTFFQKNYLFDPVEIVKENDDEIIKKVTNIINKFEPTIKDFVERLEATF